MIAETRVRKGTVAEWSKLNPVIPLGDLIVDEDTQKIKIGDGVSRWSRLKALGLSTDSSSDAIDGGGPT